MITLNDYSKAKINNQLYGGAAGQKLGININGENWFLKFPKSTKSMKNINISLCSYNRYVTFIPICHQNFRDR